MNKKSNGGLEHKVKKLDDDLIVGLVLPQLNNKSLDLSKNNSIGSVKNRSVESNRMSIKEQWK